MYTKRNKWALAGWLVSALSASAIANTELEEELQWLKAEEMAVVSVTKTARTLNTAPGIVKVYTAKDIKDMGFDTLVDIFWTLPGVQVHQALNNRRRAWFRGSQTQVNNKTVLFINGVPQRDTFGGYPSDWEIPLANIKKIEIIRGPGSALYGANAFSGVINIYTYQPGDLHGGKIEVGGGNLDTQVVHVLADHQGRFGSWLMDGNFFSTAGQRYDFSRSGAAISRSAQQKTQRINLSASFFDKRLLAHIGYRAFDNLNVRKGDQRPTQREYTNLQADLSYQQTLANEALQIEYRAFILDNKRDELESRLLTDGSLDFAERFIGRVQFSGLEALLTYQWSKSNELLVGAEFKQERLKVNDIFLLEPGQATLAASFIHRDEFKNLSLHNGAIYVQDTLTFNAAKTALTLGLRADFLERFGTQLNGRIGLVNQFTNHIFGKFLYGTAFRSPNFIEFVRVPSDPSTGDLNDVEKMKTLELQLGYGSERQLHTITYFNNRYDGFIEKIAECFADPSQTPPDPLGCGLFAEINGPTGDRKMQGLELESSFAINTDLTLFFTAAWLDTEDERTGESIPLLAQWTASAGFNYKVNVGPGQWSINHYLYAYGNRKDWDADFVRHQEQTLGQRKDSFSDGFIIWNGKLGYRIMQGALRGLEANLAVKNILDKEYYNQDLVSHDARFDENGQAQPFRARFDGRYDERTILLSLGYAW